MDGTLTAAPGVELHVLRSFSEAEPLAAAWDELAASDGDLFASFDWCRIWWRHYGHGRLEIYAAFDGHELIGLLPLRRETLYLGPIALKTVRPIGIDYAGSPSPIVIRPGRVMEMMREVLPALEGPSGYDVVQLGPLRNGTVTTSELAQACQHERGVGAVLVGEHDSCVTVFDLPDSYQGYLEGMVTSERSNIRRSERHLASEHTTGALLARSEPEIHEAMSLLVELHQAHWKARGELGQFVDWPGYEAFHRDMALAQARAGRLLLTTLEIDGARVGVDYAYHFGSRAHGLIRGYSDDPRYHQLSLGRMLHCRTVEEAIQRRATALDDGRGAFEYKQRLAGRLACQKSVVLVRAGWPSRVRFWLALRAAYLVHVLYCRIWFDTLRKRMRLPGRSLNRKYIVSHWLAELYKRGGFGLLRGQAVTYTACVNCPAWPLCSILSGQSRAQTENRA